MSYDHGVTGAEAGLSSNEQIRIALETIANNGGVASIKVIYIEVEKYMNGNHLSKQGKNSLRFFINKVAVEQGLILPYDKEKPGWHITSKGLAFMLGYKNKKTDKDTNSVLTILDELKQEAKNDEIEKAVTKENEIISKERSDYGAYRRALTNLSADYAKIIELRNETYKDVYNTSPWVYVKIQSMFEYIGKKYIYNSLWDNEFAKGNPSALQIVRYLNYKYIKDNTLLVCFEDMNSRANKIKHDNITPAYDNSFVKTCFQVFNVFAVKLFNDNGRLYQLDISVFEKVQLQKIATADESLVLSNISVQNKKDGSNITLFETQSFQIVCGVGNQDYGFSVNNISTAKKCAHPNASIYATIFSFLQRSTNARKGLYLQCLEEKERVSIDYRRVYRYEIAFLLMIRNNYVNDNSIYIQPDKGGVSGIIKYSKNGH